MGSNLERIIGGTRSVLYCTVLDHWWYQAARRLVQLTYPLILTIQLKTAITARNCVVLDCTVLFCSVLYSTVLYCSVLYCTAW